MAETCHIGNTLSMSLSIRQPVQVRRDLTGWLARYQKLVTNASEGGVLR